MEKDQVICEKSCKTGSEAILTTTNSRQQHAVTAECITVNRTVSSVGVDAKIFTIIFLLGVNSFK